MHIDFGCPTCKVLRVEWKKKKRVEWSLKPKSNYTEY